ncbi:MAG TPA: iron-containing redox enzyme family protein [Chloroflexota bacterium]|nr:iron-containing redox enzyme family protein [Chloroflexota bacterium]
MTAVSTFRKELEDAVLERHCAHHPMTQKWARGELGREAMMGWGVEHYHWVSNTAPANFAKMGDAPPDVRAVLLENYLEERDPKKPHLDIVLRFAAANGADIEAVKRGRGLPTTEAWVAWQRRVCKEEGWIAGVAATNIGTESQSPLLYSTLLPALREKYGFDEHTIEHFWLHVDADTEHGGRAFEALERYCTTRELQERAIHFARESARMRWFYFDGIYLHYELGYKLR